MKPYAKLFFVVLFSRAIWASPLFLLLGVLVLIRAVPDADPWHQILVGAGLLFGSAVLIATLFVCFTARWASTRNWEI